MQVWLGVTDGSRGKTMELEGSNGSTCESCGWLVEVEGGV